MHVLSASNSSMESMNGTFGHGKRKKNRKSINPAQQMCIAYGDIDTAENWKENNRQNLFVNVEVERQLP